MKKTHTLDIIFALMLFFVFTASVLFVLATGASVYKNVTSNMQSNYEDRTSIAYINAKIRHYDSLNGDDNNIKIGEIDGIPSLVLTENYDGIVYNTFIYCLDGYIKELFVEEGVEIGATEGFNITPVDNLEFKQVGENLISVNCSSNHVTTTSYINIKSNMEVELK